MSNNDTDRDEADAREDNAKEEAALRDRIVAGQPTDEDLEAMSTDELLALSRAAESRANVFRTLAQGDDRHSESLDKANADFQRYADALKEHNVAPTGQMIDPTLTVLDKEGTAPTLADATGTYAENAVVANVGGIGINDSNADPDGAMAKLEENAARGDMTDSPGTSPHMSRSTSIKARREANSLGSTGKSTERVKLKDKQPA